DTCTHVCEAELVARQWQRDLPVVHMTGQHEIECIRRQCVEHPREMTKEDAEIGFGVDELPRTRPTASIRARVDTDDLHRCIPDRDACCLVDEQPRGLELTQTCRV